MDCNATCSNVGTSKDPKYQLSMFFEKCLFLVIEKLVYDGGPFEGFLQVIQGDNNGPHQDKKLYKYVVNFCKAKNWLWEPQGPQMPDMNIMGFDVFPAM